MNRPRLLITAAITVIALTTVAWLARHRVRETLEQRAENQSRNTLQISPEAKALPAAPPLAVTGNDAPWWRARISIDDPDQLQPVHWSEGQNVVWKTALPGRGHSSPCVLGENVYLTSAIENDSSQYVFCLSLKTGRIAWDRESHRGEFIYANLKDSQASSTPATDGSLIFVLFPIDGAIWLSAFTPQGDLRWQTEVGPYYSKEGFGASPLIAGNFVIVAADNVGQSWLAAVHRASGTVVWRTPRGAGTSYGTPGLMESDGDTQIVMAGLERVTAYRLSDGAEIWQIPGPVLSASTPTIADGMIFVTGCTAESGVSAVEFGSPPRTLWNHKIKAEVPSQLFHDGLLYIAQDLGILNCYEADTGEQVWRKRLGGNVASSPVRIGDRILISVEDGRTFVFKAGRKGEVLAENSLDAGILATPVATAEGLLIRTLDHLYCIGHLEPTAKADSERPSGNDTETSGE